MPDELNQDPTKTAAAGAAGAADRRKAAAEERRRKAREEAERIGLVSMCVEDDEPVCINYCPVDECMYWIPDEDHPPFGRIEVDGQTCIGCKQCISKGPDGTFLDGCPWDAIDMVPVAEVEATLGVTYEF